MRSNAGTPRHLNTAEGPHAVPGGRQADAASQARQRARTYDERWDGVRDLVQLLAGRWTLGIIRTLAAGQKRHNALARALGPGVQVRTMDQTLKRMEDAGVITRHIDDCTPPAVTYRLTAYGRELLTAVGPLANLAAARPRTAAARKPDNAASA